MKTDTIIIYGSYGYTGSLIVEECRNLGLNVILAGRDTSRLKQQSLQTGYPFKVVALTETKEVNNLLKNGSVVIHCAGPFQFTSTQLVKACLDTGTHYTDITGEYPVFEMLAGYDESAKQKGIMVMPGTGFDVVPSDCLALYLKEKLPSATHLQLAFAASGGFSRGTARTMVEGLGYGSTIRKNGKLVHIKTAEKALTVDFGVFQSRAVCIPWGDIASAFRSTGIPNIEVYAGANDTMIRYMKWSTYLNPLLRTRWMKDFLRSRVDRRPAGPSAEKLKTGRSFLWGKVWDEENRAVEARLETLNGYALTAKTSVRIAKKIAEGNFKPGYHTPAMAYGAGLILEIEGTKGFY